MPTSKPLDFNAQALTVVRSILDASHTFTFQLDDKPVRVEVERLPAPPWPASGVDALNAQTDGPWPAPVRARCSWHAGSCTFVLEAGYWRGRVTYRHLVGLRTIVEGTGREVVWFTIPLRLHSAAKSGQREASLRGSIVPFHKEGEVGDATKHSRQYAVRDLVARVGLPFATEWNAELGRVELESGAIMPSPLEVFERVAKLAVVKLPFFVRDGGKGIEGEAPFSIPENVGDDEVAVEDSGATPAGKRLGLGPLPGGVRQYKQTLDVLLGEIQRDVRTVDRFNALLGERFGVTGETARSVYLGILVGLGYVASGPDAIGLTAEGEAYLATRDARTLFECLNRVWFGMLETLVIVGELAGADAKRVAQVLQGGLKIAWKTPNQVSFRRNWLLSLGLTARTSEGDTPTAEGRAVLAAHAAEVDEIRGRVEEALEALGGHDDGEASDAEVQPGLDQPKEGATEEPSAWGTADRVDLEASMIRPKTEDLVLPTGTLERVAAALSSGKHLLLVGPPGTAKTELALRIVEAARDEEYCTGAFVATASADWTTFDTIGGYMLQSDKSLRFRSGALLRALEERRWLVIDELNRADVDRAFGELMTVLAGRATDTSYELPDGRPVRVGPDPQASHPMPKSFRIIATMNTWDKTSLFRLSYALQRRFAIVTIGVPGDDSFASLVRRAAAQEAGDARLAEAATESLCRLFSNAGLLGVRELGPAIALDVVRYVRRRTGTDPRPDWGDALGEAFAMFVFPQLGNLEEEAALRAFGAMELSMKGACSPAGTSDLRRQFVDAFPHVRLRADTE